MGGFFGPGGGGGPVIAYGFINAAGALQAGSQGIASSLLAGVGDYAITFTPGYFGSIIGAWVNALSDRIGNAFPGNVTVNGCSVQTLDPALGSNANANFVLFVIGA